MDELARVRRLGRAGEQAVRAELSPSPQVCRARAARPRPAARAGRARARGGRRAGARADRSSRGDPQRASCGERLVERLLGPAASSSRPPPRCTWASMATSIRPWSPWTTLSDWRRGSARRNWSSARPRRARSEAASSASRRARAASRARRSRPRRPAARTPGAPARPARAARVLAEEASSSRSSCSRCGFSSSSRRYIAVPISAAVRSAAVASVSDWSASISHR